MFIIGVDYHPEFQQIALLDKDTGEFQEKRLTHPEEAEPFYRALAGTGQKVRVGMEASGHAGLGGESSDPAMPPEDKSRPPQFGWEAMAPRANVRDRLGHPPESAWAE